jgi:hypothetical protein
MSESNADSARRWADGCNGGSGQAELAQAYATLALVDQQRAANLLQLALTVSSPISDAYVDEARKLIGPVLAGDQ